MRICSVALLLLVFAIVPAADRPEVFPGGILNAASYALDGMPNEGIAQGSMFVVFGSGLGPTTLQQASDFPLPLTLGGTSIRVEVGGTPVDAIMLYTSAGQVAAILPSEAPAGNGTLTLTYNGQVSSSVPVRIVNANFGIFTGNQRGYGPAIVQNWSPAGVDLNSPIQAATGSQVMVLWGTGLGPVDFDERIPPQPGDLGTDVEIWVGNRQARVTYKGRSPQYPGIDQINFELPDGVTTGCYVPIAVRASGVLSNVASLAVASAGTVCTDSQGLSSSQLQLVADGGNLGVGWIQLLRVTASGTIPVTGDLGWADFFRLDHSTVLTSDPLNAWGGLALGSCTVLPVSEGLVSASRGGHLNAGPSLLLTGPKGQKTWPRDSLGVYSKNAIGAQIGPDFLQNPFRPPFLDPGSYTMASTSGGPDVGPFTATLSLPNPVPLTWNDFAAVSNIDRTQDLTITWSGGDPARDYVIVAAMTAFPNLQDPESGGLVACAERVEAGRLTVPSWALSAIPAPSTQHPSADQVFAVIRMPLLNAYTFAAPGLDVGYFAYGEISAKYVTYQ